MEVQINNSYLQSFISKYSHQSETKVVKYLAILGLHFLEKNSKEDLSLSELKAFAKSVLKPQIKQNEVDLRSIKEELLKLSKRVEGKLANSAPQQQEEVEKPKGAKKNAKPSSNPNSSKTSSSSKKVDTPTFSQKPPSARKEVEKRGSELRVSQLESIQEKENRGGSRDQKLARQSPSNRYIEWQEGSVGTTKDEYGLTPKPNEIVFTGLETRGMKNIVTRHHLDDSQFKETMKEEEIVSLRVKNETPKQQKIPVYQHHSSSKKENKLISSASFADRKPQELREASLSAWTSEMRSPQAQTQISQARSPHFTQPREYFPGEKQSYAFDINKEELSKTTAPSSATRASRRDERSSGKRVEKREDSGARNSQSSKALRPGNSLNSSKATTTTASHVRNKSNYKNVDSKIKDEINYHKELSKQYRKMKQNMGNFEDIQEELLGSSTRRAFSREPVTEDLNTLEESARYNTRHNTYNTGGSALKTSQNFAEKTPVQPAYRAHARPETGAWRNEDGNHQYTYTEESKGGMLDIANNFLNSPLMQHLSNIDIRNLDTSMKDSIFNTNFKPPKTSDSLMFTGGMEYKGTTTTYEGEDEARLRQSGGNGLGQSRNSKWENADYQLEKNIKVNASILKDSTNRRFRDNMTKELNGNTTNIYDKEGPNSLASSNFSNFLNDEMKGFYQKEPFDTKRAQVKFGNSENSSNMSFSMNGAAGTTREKSAEKTYFRRTGFKEDNENKNSETFSFDNANVFKNERMSITHLMGN